MYSVSNDFLSAMKDPAQEHKLTGTIGNISFDESNIVTGSFSITKQSTETSDVVLGSCYVGELNAEFTGINIGWNGWVGKTITPTFALKIGENQWEDVPLGIFKVKKATHTRYGVKVVAYDNMIKFDKKFKKTHFMYSYLGTYPIIETICSDCNVTLANTEQEIEAMPNGDRVLEIYGAMGKKKEFANDITTYRDLLFWVAQAMGCFATIDRNGRLLFKKYTQNVIDEVPSDQRLVGATFEDYITHYTGVYFTNLDTNDEDYYGYDSDALQAEITEVSAELAQTESDIIQVDADLAELERKHNAHEITDQEYQQQKTALTSQRKSLIKTRKQLDKRLNWLQKALENADDGADMVMGENPLLMDKNLTARNNSRKEVLGALNDISYTPFTASVLYGVIYDLGDVLQFSGGLYNSATDTFGCVMYWEYTHNLGTDLEGFGVDPAIAQVHNRTQKSVDRANKNAINAKELSNGYGTPQEEMPTGAKDGDVYIKYKKVRQNLHPIDLDEILYTDYDIWVGKWTAPQITDEKYLNKVLMAKWQTDGYAIDLSGMTWQQMGNWRFGCGYIGNPLFTVPNARFDGVYTFHCKVKYHSTYRNGNQLGFSIIYEYNDRATARVPGTWGRNAWGGGELNIDLEQDVWHEYTGEFRAPNSGQQAQAFRILFERWGAEPGYGNPNGTLEMQIRELYLTFEPDEGDPEQEFKDVVDKMYNYKEDIDPETGQTTGEGRWYEINFLSDADTSTWSGLAVDEERVVSLTPEVMRAWFKADPPQIERDFSQFCVRYTGKPDTGISISYHAGSGWEGNSLKVSDEGIYSIKCGGTRRSGEVDYVAYKIEGLVSNKRYYFNFAANIGDSATFGNDNTKGLGVIFNTTGSISSNDWSGEPHTFNNTTLYESFYRSVKKHYYDFDFVATASTMYMIVTVADISAGITTSLSLVEFVVSQEERKYIREFYLYDFHVNEWLKFKPFGTKDDGSAEGVAYLSELNDVALDNLQDGQVLEYDANTGKWINATGGGGVADYPDLTNKPSVNSVTLLGNKTSSDLGIVITLTQAQYDALPLADKQDTNKVYYITDAGSGGGGGSDVEVISDLDDVQFDSLSDGQILQYDATIQKWKNANGYSLPTASENTLGGIKVGSRLSIDQNGVLSADAQTYSLPIASANTLGGIKVGQNLSIDQDGTLNASGGGGASDLDDLTDVDISSPTNGQVLKYNSSSQKWENGNEGGGGYVLPPASDSTLGGIKVGDSLSIDSNGVLNIKQFGYVWFRYENLTPQFDFSTNSMLVILSFDKVKTIHYPGTTYYLDYTNCLFIYQSVEVAYVDGSEDADSPEYVDAEMIEITDDGQGSLVGKVVIHDRGVAPSSPASLTVYIHGIYIGTPVDSRDSN